MTAPWKADRIPYLRMAGVFDWAESVQPHKKARNDSNSGSARVAAECTAFIYSRRKDVAIIGKMPVRSSILSHGWYPESPIRG
jgi:hypothetical protein